MHIRRHIEYSLHGGIIANTIVRRLVNKRLNQMFGYRHRVTREDLRTHADVNKIKGNDGALTIAITGSSGFIGSSLIPFLTTGGHRVIRLVRKPPSYGEDALIIVVYKV
ncbi:MAG: hypothetical protein WAM14_17395 [Candidatus Nitrosopolaris sp.]